MRVGLLVLAGSISLLSIACSDSGDNGTGGNGGATGGTGGTGGTSGTGGAGGCAPPFSTSLDDSVWREVYTCITADGCLGENVLLDIELAQPSPDEPSSVLWRVTGGVDEGSEYAGVLCGTAYEWENVPPTPTETGCWTFDGSGGFNKLSSGRSNSGDAFDCIGVGVEGTGDPGTILDCEQLRAIRDMIDFDACPPAPPAPPQGSTN